MVETLRVVGAFPRNTLEFLQAAHPQAPKLLHDGRWQLYARYRPKNNYCPRPTCGLIRPCVSLGHSPATTSMSGYVIVALGSAVPELGFTPTNNHTDDTQSVVRTPQSIVCVCVCEKYCRAETRQLFYKTSA